MEFMTTVQLDIVFLGSFEGGPWSDRVTGHSRDPSLDTVTF